MGQNMSKKGFLTVVKNALEGKAGQSGDSSALLPRKIGTASTLCAFFSDPELIRKTHLKNGQK